MVIYKHCHKYRKSIFALTVEDNILKMYFFSLRPSRSKYKGENPVRGNPCTHPNRLAL